MWFEIWFHVKEVIDQGLLDQISPRTDLILPMVTEILMTPIKVDGPSARQHCLRAVRAIQLLTGILYQRMLLLQFDDCFSIMF